VINTAYVLPTDDLALLALFNSKLIWFYFIGIASSVQSGYYRCFREYIEPLPIVTPDDEHAQKLATLAARRMKVTGTGGQELENEMNGIIYEMYGVTPEEREIIESHWPSEST
jgi:hypothetical protein